jgi:hypothetical protein
MILVMAATPQALRTSHAECQQPNWDGYGTEPVAEDTYRFAYRFLESLPLGTPSSSVGAEADGHLTFEWYQGTDRLLSVSINPDGIIYYAALLGRSKRFGTGAFHGEVPENVLSIIRKLYAT